MCIRDRPWEDIAVTESMGEVDHSQEFLGEADFVIIKNRRFLAQILEKIETGHPHDLEGSNAANLRALRSVAFRHSSELDWKTIDGKNPPKSAV